MRSFSLTRIAASIALSLAPILICCREHRDIFRVDLPSHFTGAVHIGCGGTGDDLQPVPVDKTGKGFASTCSLAPVDLQVIRDGQMVEVDGLTWGKTGDGLPAELTFSVR